MIKTYPSKAAYEAAEKSVMESTVSLIENTNRIAINGVNVVVDDPKVGDIVCYDEDRKIKFIALDTFQAGTFPAAWETVGVVVLRKGNQVKIVSKTSESKKWMDVYQYIVSGYTLDGIEHTATLKLHGSDTLDFKYTATTDAEFLEDLQSFLVNNGFTDWSAYIMDGQVILQYDNYTSAEYYGSSVTYATGFTLSTKTILDNPNMVSSFWRKCGNRGNGIWHTERVKEIYVRDQTSIAFNPTSDLSSVPPYPVCYPAFCGTSAYQDDHCLWLRQKYCKDSSHPTLEEWRAYIDDLEHIIPYMLGGNSPERADGKTVCDMLKDKTYRASDGTFRKLYVAVDYCTGFLDGQGYLPSMTELIECFGNVTYGLSGVDRDKSDQINRSLYAIGGSAIPCSDSFWTSGLSNFNLAWIVYANGFLEQYNLFNSIRSVAFAQLELPQD